MLVRRFVANGSQRAAWPSQPGRLHARRVAQTKVLLRVAGGKIAAIGSPLFFFSSRRRHTRFDCDWSSDVCSSDLRLPSVPPLMLSILRFNPARLMACLA